MGLFLTIICDHEAPHKLYRFNCIVFYLVGLYPKLGQGVNSPVKMDIFTPGLQGPWRISRGDVGFGLINPFNSGTFKNIGFYRKTLL